MFNQNMLSTGLLADGAREYLEVFDKRWLVTSYEAGDVVLHNPFAVRHLNVAAIQSWLVRRSTPRQ